MMCTWHCCQRPAEQDMLCLQHYKLMRPPVVPQLPPEPVIDQADEFSRRPFGSVNAYVRELERENATLRRRVRVLEELVAKI